MNELKNLTILIFTGLLTGCVNAGCDYDLKTEQVICTDDPDPEVYLAKNPESKTYDQELENTVSEL